MNSNIDAAAGYTLFVFLVWLIIRDRQRFLEAWRSRNWKPVKARVTDVKDQTYELDGVCEYSGAYVTTNTARFYTFSYSIAGTKYESRHYSFEGDDKSSMPCFHAGDEVTIYHDPRQPSESVVKRGLSLQMLFVPFVAICALAWAVCHLR